MRVPAIADLMLDKQILQEVDRCRQLGIWEGRFYT
jgi:hypothetical protein